jgi:hypothetical protein
MITINFVDNKLIRGTRIANHACHHLVVIGRPCLRIDNKNQKISFPQSDFDLTRDRIGNAFYRFWHIPTCINKRKCSTIPKAFCIISVSGHAGENVHNSFSLTQQAIKKR